MSAPTTPYVDGNCNAVTADKLNAVNNEINNNIASSGLSLDEMDETQTAKTSTIFAHNGNYYNEDGASAADAYVITTPSPRVPVTVLLDGMVFRFFTAFANTGACTLTVDAFSSKNLLLSAAGAPLSGGEIPASSTITVVYNLSLDSYILLDTGFSLASPLSNAVYFTTPGTTNWIVPNGVTACRVIVTGGGGYSAGFPDEKAGGAGTAIKKITGLTSGQSISVTVGSAGNVSSFGTFCSATPPSSPTEGGHGVGGDLNIHGGNNVDSPIFASTIWGNSPAFGGFNEHGIVVVEY